MNSLRLEPISSVAGVVNLPGSKSVSNRALLLAALARGTTRLTNLLDSDDIRHMLAALTQLGVKYKLSADKTECTVHGLGRSFAVSAPVNLFLGNNEYADGFTPDHPDIGGWSCFDYPSIVRKLEREAGRTLRYSVASSLFARKDAQFARTDAIEELIDAFQELWRTNV